VRCGGELHTILLNCQGHPVLANHTREDILDYRNLAKLGGPLCPCLQVHDRWLECVRNHQKGSGLPKALREAAKAALQFHEDRQSQRRHGVDTLVLQRPAIVAALMERILKKQLGTPELAVTCESRYCAGELDQITLFWKNEPVFCGTIHSNWVKAVYHTGLAVINGALTLDISNWHPPWLPGGYDHDPYYKIAFCVPARGRGGHISFRQANCEICFGAAGPKLRTKGHITSWLTNLRSSFQFQLRQDIMGYAANLNSVSV